MRQIDTIKTVSWICTMRWAFLRLGAAACQNDLNQDFGRSILLWQSVNVSETQSPHIPSLGMQSLSPHTDSAQKIRRIFNWETWKFSSRLLTHSKIGWCVGWEPNLIIFAFSLHLHYKRFWLGRSLVYHFPRNEINSIDIGTMLL